MKIIKNYDGNVSEFREVKNIKIGTVFSGSVGCVDEYIDVFYRNTSGIVSLNSGRTWTLDTPNNKNMLIYDYQVHIATLTLK